MERCVILTTGASLEAPLHELALLEEETAPAPVTLRDAERAHIRKILKEADGVIATAAQRLGLPRSTLFYKMRRLGIRRRANKSGPVIQASSLGDTREGSCIPFSWSMTTTLSFTCAPVSWPNAATGYTPSLERT